MTNINPASFNDGLFLLASQDALICLLGVCAAIVYCFWSCFFQPAKPKFIAPKVSDNQPTQMRKVKMFQNLFTEGLSYPDFFEPPKENQHRIVSYRVEPGFFVTVVHGSVATFESDRGVIVNSANEEGLGGGGIDKTITEAGGPNLVEARKLVPEVDGVRFPTGTAKLLGPDSFGNIKTPFVMMAVGPDYSKCINPADVRKASDLLCGTYTSVLDATLDTRINQVAFPLISGGAFRGEQDIKKVMELAMTTIHVWIDDHKKDRKTKLRDIAFFAMSRRDAKKLVAVCDDEFGGCLKAKVT